METLIGNVKNFEKANSFREDAQGFLEPVFVFLPCSSCAVTLQESKDLDPVKCNKCSVLKTTMPKIPLGKLKNQLRE
eukprot:snap_masked-scaffold_38-processed-gene-1.48-mRNA-1 protein AED:0.42 eAED:1.00 QI:0/-1/0/1/-1/1/1/0/76